MTTDAMTIPISMDMGRRSTIETKGKNEVRDYSDKKEMEKTMKDPQTVPDKNPDTVDNLQKIKGIGTLINKALQKSEINTYTKLAESSPDQLVEILKNDFPTISVQRILKDNWIGQAQKILSDSEPKTGENPLPDTDEISSRIANKDIQEGWDELADFFVSFGYAIEPEGNKRLQTKIHHSQNDLLAKWDGIAIEALNDWMLAQANLPFPSEMLFEKDDKSLVSADMEISELNTNIQVANLRVSQVVEAVSTNQSEVGKMLKIDGQLVLEGPEAIDLTLEQYPYKIEIYLINTHNNQSELVATTDDYLQPNKITYRIEEMFEIPPSGDYQLFIVARLLPPETLIAHQQGPMIRVKVK